MENLFLIFDIYYQRDMVIVQGLKMILSDSLFFFLNFNYFMIIIKCQFKFYNILEVFFDQIIFFKIVFSFEILVVS